MLYLKFYSKNKWYFLYEKYINCLYKCFINLEIILIKSIGILVL